MFKTTLGIDGMTCGMCEAHVNDAIRQRFKVKKVSSSHGEGQTVIISKEEISEEDIHKAIDPTGYVITSYRTEPYEKKGLFGLG